MNKYISKKTFIIINIILFMIECILIYLMVNALVTKDLIVPNNISILEYLKIRLTNII